MPVLSTLPTSRRMYLSQAELAQFADIIIDDTTEADDQISQAEEIVDAYVGFADKWYPQELVGLMTGAISAHGFQMETQSQNVYEKNYFAYCQVEIIGGTGAGQRRTIASSAKDGSIVMASDFATAPDSTSFYRITQLGKFPRPQDVMYYSTATPYQYLKTIPEAIRRAVAAQVEYMTTMGPSFFASDKTEKMSERIGDYSYSNGFGSQGQSATLKKMIAPKARLLLKAYITRVGSL